MTSISESSRDLENELIQELEKISQKEPIKKLVKSQVYIQEEVKKCVEEIDKVKSQNPKPEEKNEQEEDEDPIRDLRTFLMVLKATNCPDYIINEVINTRIRQKKIPYKLDTQEIIELTLLLGNENVRQVFASRPPKYSPICGNEIESFDLYWICRACNRLTNSNQISLLCTDCYKEEKHKDHKEEVEFRINSNQVGTCEC